MLTNSSIVFILTMDKANYLVPSSLVSLLMHLPINTSSHYLLGTWWVISLKLVLLLIRILLSATKQLILILIYQCITSNIFSFNKSIKCGQLLVTSAFLLIQNVIPTTKRIQVYLSDFLKIWER